MSLGADEVGNSCKISLIVLEARSEPALSNTFLYVLYDGLAYSFVTHVEKRPAYYWRDIVVRK